MRRQSRMVMRLLLLSFLSQAWCEEMTVRLSASPYFGAGYVEVWREGRWGAVCAQPDSLSQATADLLCRHLGFSGSIKHQQGETSYAPHPRGVFRVTDSLACPPGAELLSQCQLAASSGCSAGQVLSLICRPEAKSGCGPQSTAMLGHCYRIFQERKTFPQAQAECQKISANLVEIGSQKENLLLASLVEKSPEHRDTTTYWTGGVISEIANAKFTIWHGSQNKIVFDNQIDKNRAKEKPHGISFQTKREGQYPGWRTEDMDTRLPFICQNVPENIGCLKADDPFGSNYVGPATRDRDGNLCAAWNGDQNYRWADNYCRNPDNNDRPYCLLPGGEPSNCDIPLCPLLPRPSSLECRGAAGLSVNTCHKEEYHCRSGRCISNDYVCDGARDCQDGDDEEDCRVLSSLFVVTENYKLEGNLKAKTSESVRASLEECARLCLYQKMNGTGCCDSFSHRAAKDGKDDRCTLGSVYVTNSLNSSIDSLVEKKAWNYYKLNDTADTNSQCGLNFNWKRELDGKQHFVAVRLNNKQRGSKGNLLEVKLVGQDWGGVCQDGFGSTEASLVCRQLGFKLGARKVLAVAGRPVVSGLRCGGQEQSLAECSPSGSLGCPSGQVVALDCLKSRCEETEFQCGSGECIATAGLCDSVAQCQDGSDEAEDHCGARTNVRLTQPGGHKGLLELRHRGVWGSVCDFNFGRGEADVFCHMLGFDRAANWTSGELDVFRSGSWPVWISFGSPNSCTGAEETLEECHDKSHWNDDQSCRHSEDVFLECKNDDPEQQSKAARKTVQLVSQCGLWRKLPEEREESRRVTGGSSVEHGLLPWQASIRLQGPSKSSHHCGAIIISPFHLLTAAHCLWSHRDNIELYYVRVGDNALQIKDEEEQEFAIGKVDFHENFNIGPYQNNDIAVVHIDKIKHRAGIRFGDKVIPACLPQHDADYSSRVNVTVSGWGKTNFGSNSVSRLHMVNVPIIDSDVCRTEEVYGEEKISNGMFCAGRLEGGLDSCQGDSGGPAVSLLTVPEFGELRATALGITSWGYGCGRPNKPGVYTRLSHYVDWIYKKATKQ